MSEKVTVGEFEQIFESVKNWGRWGCDDEDGKLNFVTPEKVRAAAALSSARGGASRLIDAHTHVDALCHLAFGRVDLQMGDARRTCSRPAQLRRTSPSTTRALSG